MTGTISKEIVKELVNAVVGALSVRHPDEDVAGVEIVYRTVKHDGTPTHDSCLTTNRHLGLTMIPSRVAALPED